METPTDQVAPAHDPLVDRTRALLEAHVPLRLLLEVARRVGPCRIGQVEQEPADLSWLRPV